jgi:PmbA protein
VIGRILDALAGRVAAADAVVKTDDTLTLSISPDGDTRVAGARSQLSHLRVARQGRIGFAFATGDESSELVGRAMAGAASGEELDLFLPAPAPLPEVVTRAPQAAAADAAVLHGLARALYERLTRTNRRVEAWAERSAGSVQVANTRSVLAGYEVSLAGIGAVVESIGAESAPPCRVHYAGVALPTLLDLELLVGEVDRRLDPPILGGAGSRPDLLVCLAPRAVATLVRPVRAALTGYEALLGRSPLRGRLGEQVFDEKLSLTDDPVAPGRPGSRPVDDDGVVSRRVPLIERGRLAGFASDVLVGARAQVPSTGHAWRLPNAAPRVGLTNLRMEPGADGREALLAEMGRGVLIEDLEWGAGANALPGTIFLRAPWAYLIEGGTIRGRLEGVTVSGNVFEALRRIRAVGNDATWVGAQELASMVVEGLVVRIEDRG